MFVESFSECGTHTYSPSPALVVIPIRLLLQIMDLLKSASGAAEAAPKMEDEEGLMWRPSKGDIEGHQLEIIRK